MTTGILSSPSALAFLRAFDCNHLEPTMVMPIPSSSSPAEFEMVSVGPGSRDTILKMGRSVEREAREILGSATKRPLAQTNGLWSVTRATCGINIVASDPTQAKWDNIFLAFPTPDPEMLIGEVILMKHSPYQSVEMGLELSDHRISGFREEGFNYCLKYEDVALNSLRLLCQVRAGSSLSELCIGILKLCGATEDELAQSAAFQSHPLGKDLHQMELPESQILVLTEQIGDEALISEVLELSIRPHAAHVSYNPLPRALHRLWERTTNPDKTKGDQDETPGYH